MINSRDFDRLSAYIDNQLPARERADLESRLAREPELQATLKDLQRTVRVLSLLPVVKPPRRFTLTPAMVGARPRREPLFPALRVAAAFCALVLAVVVAGDLATSGGLTSLTSTAREASAPVTVTAALEVPAADGASATASPESLLQTYAASEATPTANAADIGGTPAMSVAVIDPSPTPEGTDHRAAATLSSPDKNLEPTATPAGSEVALELAPPAPSATPLLDATTDDSGGASAAAEKRPGGLGPLRVFEIAMAMLTVLLALGAWFTRRTS